MRVFAHQPTALAPLPMFDIGFSEIVVIAVVALIVIGPERLPKTARTLGHLFGRLQRYVADVKADINREMQLDELKKLQQEVRSAATEIETSVTAAARDVETGVRSVESELNAAAMPAEAPAAHVDAGASSAPCGEHAGSRRCGRAAAPGVAARSRPRLTPSPGPTMTDASPPPEGAQETFISHLIELRSRLLRSIVAVDRRAAVPVPVGKADLRRSRRAAAAGAADRARR